MASYNLADLFESVVDTVPDRTALVAGTARLSFAELDARANRLAHHLAGAGIGHGDPVGLYAYNRAEWVEAMWACFKIRAVPININYRYVEDELFYIADNADLKAIIFERDFTPLLVNLQSRLPKLQHYVVIEDGSSHNASPLAAEEYEAALSTESDQRDFAARSSDDLYMLYTGGTTGMPKGTLWRHEDIFFAALQGGNPGGEPIGQPEQLPHLVAGNNPIATLCPAPMMHGGGQWYCMIYQLAGHTFVLYSERHFDPEQLVRMIEQERVVSLIVVGDAMARPVAETIAKGQYNMESLFVVGSGGAILSPAVKQQFRELLPNVLLMDSFGASETGSGGAVLAQENNEGGPRFTLAANTAVLDEQLNPIAPEQGGIGLLARCGHIPLGYYKDEAKTAETFKTNAQGVRWVIPGDWARVLPDGTAELLGRGSVCINSGGEKIHPEEVEAALKAHPDVFDAGVVGVADERFGQKVVGMVQLRPGVDFNAQQISAFCREKVAGYKCPRHLFAVESVPRTPVAKTDYRKLKTLAESLLAQA